MRLPVKRAATLCFLVLVLSGIVLMRYEPILNWHTAWTLRNEKDAKARVAIINSTLPYERSYWNRQYLREALRADAEWERWYLGDLIGQRFGTNAKPVLRSLLKEPMSEASRSNVLAVISKVPLRVNSNHD